MKPLAKKVFRINFALPQHSDKLPVSQSKLPNKNQMSMRIEVQPATRCPLGNPRSQVITEALYLRPESSSNSPYQWVTLVVKRQQTPVSEAFDFTLLAVVVNVDGENHPYSLDGENCSNGIFKKVVSIPAGEDKTFISLERVIVRSCQQNKWREAMARKRDILQASNINIAEPSSTVSAKNVKKFRINFYIPLWDNFAASTSEIEGFTTSAASGAAATAQAAALSLSVVKILTASPWPCCTSGGTPTELAILLREPLDINSQLNVQCTVDGFESQPFYCEVKAKTKHLVELALRIPERLARELDASGSKQFTLCLEAGAANHSARLGQLPFQWGCDRCDSQLPPSPFGLAAASASPAAAVVVVNALEQPEPRRKLAGGSPRPAAVQPTSPSISLLPPQQRQQQQQQIFLTSPLPQEAPVELNAIDFSALKQLDLTGAAAAAFDPLPALNSESPAAFQFNLSKEARRARPSFDPDREQMLQDLMDIIRQDDSLS